MSSKEIFLPDFSGNFEAFASKLPEKSGRNLFWYYVDTGQWCYQENKKSITHWIVSPIAKRLSHKLLFFGIRMNIFNYKEYANNCVRYCNFSIESFCWLRHHVASNWCGRFIYHIVKKLIDRQSWNLLTRNIFLHLSQYLFLIQVICLYRVQILNYTEWLNISSQTTQYCVVEYAKHITIYVVQRKHFIKIF